MKAIMFYITRDKEGKQLNTYHVTGEVEANQRSSLAEVSEELAHLQKEMKIAISGMSGMHSTNFDLSLTNIVFLPKRGIL